MTKIIFILFSLFLFSALGLANDFETDALLEKTFVHDNSYCRLNNKVVEFEIRSSEKYTQPDDAEFGENIFALQDENRTLIPLSDGHIARFKLFKGKHSFCTKTLAIKTGKDSFAIFFLKDNRPLGHLLSVLFYDLKLKTNKVLNTDYSTAKAFVQNDKLKFPALNKTYEGHMGKTKIENADYIYRDAELTVWMTFDGKDFEADPLLTYDKFDWKNHFSKEEFEKLASWNPQTKKYDRPKYTVAVNHKLKRRCVAFSMKPTTEIPISDWKCREAAKNSHQ